MEQIGLYTLQAGRVQAEITNVGGRLVRLLVDGIDVVQGFDRPEDYLPENHLSDFGAVVGRYANRLAGGRITVGDRNYQLPQNNGPNCLHGGPRGWQYSIYHVEQYDGQRLELSMTSPDGDQGFPGEVKVRVVYTLSADGGLRIDYRAVSDRPTVINMTNHSYFNLNGDLSSSVLNHTLMIAADFYTPVDGTQIPLGEHVPVNGTPFDFTVAKAIGRDIEADDEQLRIGQGYDNNFVLRHRGEDCPAAVLESPQTGIRLEVMTDAPGIQLYTGNFLDGVEGKGGVRYPRRSAVCLETQQYPDSPNHCWPESTGRLSPEQPFHSTTVFKLTRHD